MTAVILPGTGAANELPPAGTPSASRPAGTPRTVLGAVYRWIARVLMVVAVAAFAGLAVGPHVFGYRTMTMLTGSMAPKINPGDVAQGAGRAGGRGGAGRGQLGGCPRAGEDDSSHDQISGELVSRRQLA